MCASVLGWPRGIEGLGDAWALGRGPPRRRARPMCGEGEREYFCAAARLGPRSPCQQRRAPRVLVRASLARVLRLGIVWR
jgi:hypothetical protein